MVDRRDVVSVTEAAWRLGIHPNTVRKWYRDGLIKADGRTTRGGLEIPRTEVERLIRDRGRGRDPLPNGRTVEEIRAKIEELEKLARNPRFPKSVAIAIHSRRAALLWVLGEGDGEL